MSTLYTDVSAAFQGASLNKEDVLVLACSGGKDSMVLLHVLVELGFQPTVAHVNFKLRGADSESDEAFVRDFCAEKNLPFYSTHFHTETEANENKESIQMAARRLRYTWLFSLMDELGAQRLLTAHHERDQAETMLLNLMRGTGPQGLQGMLVDDGRLLRPMLRSSYEEIDRLAKTKKIVFREDKSNASVKYKRNFIRHTLLTPWEDAYPGTVRQFSRSSEIMQEVNVFLTEQLASIAQIYVQLEGNEVHIDSNLAEHPSARLVLRHILGNYGLVEQVPFILEAKSRSGALFSSTSHVLLVDRTSWIIREKQTKGVQKPELHIDLPTSCMSPLDLAVGAFKFQLLPIVEPSIERGTNAILLPKSALEEGLYFRNWRLGDRMQPFGMKGSKKLSDIFIDSKVSRLDKEEIPILCSKNADILWIPGVKSGEKLRLKSQFQAEFILKIKA